MTDVAARPRLTVDIEAGVADVRLDRADKLNALDGAMFDALGSTARELAEDSSVRAVVLSGNGRAFCAGLDFGSFRAMQQSGDGPSSPRELVRRTDENPANRAQFAAWGWHAMPVPVIAAVHGVAYGGGFQIALGADLRVVHPEARLSVREIVWGLIPDMAGPQLLRHLVRADIAKELTFTGRVISGVEAAAQGLVTPRCENPLDDAQAQARQIAANSPHAIRAAKQVLDTASTVSVREGLETEERLQVGLIGSPNQVEAVMANMEKRAPSFADVD
ncbi:MAG: crotonase/enoyl-CoA hydratase family protein [Holophagales bacterium]|nr:crotonase/enoyl-CoA hydratase family protein [Holophagales bacterium]